MKLHFVDHPRELYDYLVPREYQPLLEKGALAWCLACWAFAIGFLLLSRRQPGFAPRLKAKKS